MMPSMSVGASPASAIAASEASIWSATTLLPEAVGRLTDPGDRASLLETHDPVLRREAARPRRPSTRRAGVRARHSASTPGLSNVTRPRASSGSLTWVVLGAYAHPNRTSPVGGGARRARTI